VAERAAGAVRFVGQNAGGPRGSELLARRGGGWHFEVVDVPLADLKAGAKAAGGSLNEIAAARVNQAAVSLSATHMRSSIWQVVVALVCLLIGTVVCILTIRSIVRPGWALIATVISDGSCRRWTSARFGRHVGS